MQVFLWVQPNSPTYYVYARWTHTNRKWSANIRLLLPFSQNLTFFFYLKRERQRKRERDNLKQALCWSLMRGSVSEIMSGAEIKSQTLNQRSHPGAPQSYWILTVVTFIVLEGRVFMCLEPTSSLLTLVCPPSPEGSLCTGLFKKQRFFWSQEASQVQPAVFWKGLISSAALLFVLVERMASWEETFF